MKSINLLGAIAVALVACSCSSSSVAVKETATSNGSANSLSRERQLASDVFDEVNRYRLSQGLKALKPHNGLTAMAKRHSEYMKNRAANGNEKLSSHYGFDARRTMAQKKYRMENLSENVIASHDMGQGSDLAQKMVQGWASSPNHRHNLHSKWARTGVAVSFDDQGRAFVTQLFGSEPSQVLKVGGPATF